VIEACLLVEVDQPEHASTEQILEIALWSRSRARNSLGLIVEEKRNRDILKAYHPQKLSLHTITL
jgi:hypothetical protein